MPQSRDEAGNTTGRAFLRREKEENYLDRGRRTSIGRVKVVETSSGHDGMRWPHRFLTCSDAATPMAQSQDDEA